MTRRVIAIATAAAGAMLWPAGGSNAASVGSTVAQAAGPVAQAGPVPQKRRALRKCQGKRATIVGRKGRTLRGTNRRDVIVTNGADLVQAGGGNDLICVTGGRATSVRAGNGNDKVVVQQRKGYVYAVLGRGADTYRGNRTNEDVYAAGDGSGTGDRHRDVIRTRGGDDTVSTGRTNATNKDYVHLGPGRDELWNYSFDNPRGEFRAGGGEDIFYFMKEERVDPAAEWVFDNVRGTITDRGRLMAGKVRGFDVFQLGALAGTSQHFIGGSADETVDLNAESVVSADMGGGDDTVHLSLDEPVEIAARGILGGRGRDEISFDETWGSVTGDIGTQTASSTYDGVTHTVRFSGFEDMFASSWVSVVLSGDNGPNRLTGYSCDTTISGGAGDDVLTSDGFIEDSTCAKPATLKGEEGDDDLVGGRYDDHLDGGPGNDSADGRGGTDVCVAERTINCEG